VCKIWKDEGKEEDEHARGKSVQGNGGDMIAIHVIVCCGFSKVCNATYFPCSSSSLARNHKQVAHQNLPSQHKDTYLAAQSSHPVAPFNPSYVLHSAVPQVKVTSSRHYVDRLCLLELDTPPCALVAHGLTRSICIIYDYQGNEDYEYYPHQLSPLPERDWWL
jgi:hypothetical protein